MFTWNFATKIFDGFTILRWTDFIKPIEFVEIEKHATQSILTYIIGKEYEENSGTKLDWNKIVHNNIYGYLTKIATSDIKSPLHARIKSEKLKELNQFIINTYFKDNNPLLFPEDTICREEFEEYLNNKNQQSGAIEDEICYFAHKYATSREFLIIKKLNELSPDTKLVESTITNILNVDKCENNVLKKIFSTIMDDKSDLYNFYSYFEKLRPQVRWSQTCRLPQTTVLGHSMYVAILVFFAIKELDIKSNYISEILPNSFYSALFHDLPESLTRDIISPVKRSIKGLEEDLLEHFEYVEVEENMVSRLKDRKWKDHFMYMLGKTTNSKDEYIFKPFKDRPSDKPQILGQLIKYMDSIAAFVEAKMSVDLGINSVELQNGIKYTYSSLTNKEYDYRSSLGERSNKVLHLNDFFASIPNYTIGPNLKED